MGLISQISRQISRFEAFLRLLKRTQQGLSQLLAVLNQHWLLAAVATTARFSHLTNRQEQGLLAAIRPFRNRLHPPQLRCRAIAALAHSPGQAAAVAVGIQQQHLSGLAITACTA